MRVQAHPGAGGGAPGCGSNGQRPSASRPARRGNQCSEGTPWSSSRRTRRSNACSTPHWEIAAASPTVLSGPANSMRTITWSSSRRTRCTNGRTAARASAVAVAAYASLMLLKASSSSACCISVRFASDGTTLDVRAIQVRRSRPPSTATAGGYACPTSSETRNCLSMIILRTSAEGGRRLRSHLGRGTPWQEHRLCREGGDPGHCARPHQARSTQRAEQAVSRLAPLVSVRCSKRSPPPQPSWSWSMVPSVKP